MLRMFGEILKKFNKLEIIKVVFDSIELELLVFEKLLLEVSSSNNGKINIIPILSKKVAKDDNTKTKYNLLPIKDLYIDKYFGSSEKVFN